MGKTQIENQNFIAQINSFGAEPSRLFDKRSSREVLWDGQEKYWARHAPVLFPTVGKLKEGHFLHQGKKYELGQHGFARDMEWQLITAAADRCTYRLSSDDRTLYKYPFSFTLSLEATLTSEGLNLHYEVENHSTEVMYYA